MPNDRANVPAETTLTSDDRWFLLRAMVATNAACNGRYFCLGLALLNMLAGNRLLALGALLPLAMAVLVERVPIEPLRPFLSFGMYGVAVTAAVASFLAMW